MPRPLLQVSLVLVIMLTASYFGNLMIRKGQGGHAGANSDGLPGVYLQAPRGWAYNEQGALTDILEADSMQQFPPRDESLLQAPRFYSHSGDDRTWSATADRGRYLQHQDSLELSDNVVLSHDQTGSRLETTVMDINLQEKTATSTREVIISDGDNRTRASGMIAWLETEKILLQPNVESIYVQPQP